MTQQQVAERVGKTLRSVGNWERAATVPRSAEARLRAALPEWFGQPAAPLAAVSDAQLLAEIARRFERGREEVVGNEDHPAPIVTKTQGESITPPGLAAVAPPPQGSGLKSEKDGQ